MLPTSGIYDYLEGRIPNPAHTYTRIVEIVEALEKQKINKEIGERRTRLGARVGQVTAEVKREVYGSSDLENLYGCIINWTSDDDMRRQYEEKILQRAYDTLVVLPHQEKTEKRLQVQKLAEGLVILKHPFALAWKVVLEWKDAESFKEWDVGLLREYIEFFPEDGLSKLLKAYLESEISPFPKLAIAPATEEKAENGTQSMTVEDRLLLMTEGLEESSRSIMSQRLMAEYYLFLEEYSSSVESSKQARELLRLESDLCGLKFQDSLDAINIILATSFVQYQTPRNHSEARAIFDEVLSRKPNNTSALIGIGLILEEDEDYEGAIDFLGRAVQRNPNVKVQAEKAWCTALNGDLETGLHELENCLSDLNASDPKVKELKAETLYRIGMCIWNLDTSKTARKDRNGAYSRFLASLQANLNYAPAYTSLGKYYADYAKDRNRARKCFQKAFELSASEVEAAERLARSFADQQEWDLVEVVAQRVVESGKTRPPPGSRKPGVSWPYAALGVVQLNNQEYAKSIVSFQSALRIAPDDVHSWIGLGESYHNSGRYLAAMRALEQAQKLETKDNRLDPADIWFSKYMLANVRRELGDFDEAITDYANVLTLKPQEFGVSIALLQTYIESAWRSIELGFFGEAAGSAIKVISLAKEIVGTRNEAFNLWKAVGDACSIFSWVQASIGDFPLQDLSYILLGGEGFNYYDILAEVDGTGKAALEALPSSRDSPLLMKSSMTAAILAHKRAIHVCSNDVHAQAVAWYNLGWTQYRSHSRLVRDTQLPSPKKLPRHLKAAVRCFKRAIELEAGNSEFWNALGIVTTQVNPKVAQHAYIRSLYLNDKSARVWTNLGTLYLFQEDYQLANDAFARAQSTDPDYSYAWVGQGILANLLGESEEAQGLFTHAFEISDASSLAAKQQYITSTFDALLSLPNSSNQLTDLLQPLFALHQMKSQGVSDNAYQHLFSLFAERVSDHVGVATLDVVCKSVENDYEVSESPLSLARYAQAKADLARIQLATRDYIVAAENAELALDLSAEEDSSSPDPVARKKYRLSAHLTAGLAYHFLSENDKAIAMFRTALEETDSNPDVVCILAQTLWAKRGAEERHTAQELLFNCVEAHPGHVGATTLLGVIALLTDDLDAVEAVATDLHAMRVREDIYTSEQGKIGRILEAVALTSTDQHSQEKAEAMTAVMLAAWQPHGWAQLADLEVSEGESYPAEMALLTALGSVPPKGTLDAEDLARTHAGTKRPADAQRAIMLAPWLVEGWGKLVT